MRYELADYELADYEWIAIKPMLPNKPRGVPRVNDRRARLGEIFPRCLVRTPHAITASSAGGGPMSGAAL